jgi:signal transduction histidine kinase
VSFLAPTDQPDARFRGRELLRAVAEGTAGAVGDEFLRSLVRHVALAFDAKLVFVAEATEPNGKHVRVVSCWYDGDWMDAPIEYDTHGQPCALVAEQAVVAFPAALTRHFPEDSDAIEMGLESYLAICLRGAEGTHLGHLAVLDARPMEAGDDDVAAMRIFASRAAAELERRHQAAALRRSRARVIGAADSERRRVGRDLHDGAQQRLMAVANLVKLAERQLDEDHEAVKALRLALDAETLLVEIVDDGCGGADPAAGTGLRGLADRIDSLGGRLDVDSPVGAGTRVSARLPLDADRAQA